MRLFSRLLLVAVLMGGLAYGSYAFGKHVLSSALFAPRDSGNRPRSATAGSDDGTTTVFRSDTIRGEPRADIDILPPGEEGDDPEPSLSAVRRSTERSPSSSAVYPDDAASRLDDAENASGRASDSPDDVEESDPTEEPTRRPRRRKRRVTKPDADRSAVRETPTQPRAEASRVASDAPARALNDEPSERETRSSTAEEPRETRSEPGLAQPVPVERARERANEDPPERREETPRPTRRRERIRREPVSVPSRPAPAPARERQESPIPRPEGDTGGSSPVPLPG